MLELYFMMERNNMTNDNISELFKKYKYSIISKNKKLKCAWTEDLAEYMKDRWGVDLEKEMEECLAESIRKELESERIREICDNVVKQKYPHFKR